jgi:hypothetical protein
VADYNHPSAMGVDEKLFFHLFDLAILSSYMLFFFMWWEENFTQRFRLVPLRNMLAVAGQK